MWSTKPTLLAVALVAALCLLMPAGAAFQPAGSAARDAAAPTDDLVFIHHSVGSNWLNAGLETALLAKPYIDERNDIGYGTAMAPDPGRPASLGGVPGDQTDMHHWILWFNDYLQGVGAHGSSDGYNRIIMFKSCYPNSDIGGDGSGPGDPFSSSRTLTNYRAVYRHPLGSGATYTHDGAEYRALEDVFAAYPDVLFVVVTAPPLHYGATTDANAHRARLFNNWLRSEWLPAYNAAHPGLDNVAVFDLFNLLAYADNHPLHPNRLRAEFGGASGDSHPNEAGSDAATALFAGDGAFLDGAWAAFVDSEPPISLPIRQYLPFCTTKLLGDGTGFVNSLFEMIRLRPPWLLCP